MIRRPDFYEARVLKRLSIRDPESFGNLYVGKTVYARLLQAGWVKETLSPAGRKMVLLTEDGLAASDLKSLPHHYSKIRKTDPRLKIFDPRLKVMKTPLDPKD